VIVYSIRMTARFSHCLRKVGFFVRAEKVVDAEEADIRRQYVLPKVYAPGWDDRYERAVG